MIAVDRTKLQLTLANALFKDGAGVDLPAVFALGVRLALITSNHLGLVYSLLPFIALMYREKRKIRACGTHKVEVQSHLLIMRFPWPLG